MREGAVRDIHNLHHLSFCPCVWVLSGSSTLCFIVALRPWKQDGLLGTGTEWVGDDRVKARPWKPPEKDWRDHGPPPEQWKCYGGVPSPLPSNLCTAQLLLQLLYLDSHKDDVHRTAVNEQLGQLEAKEVQFVQPSSTSLLMISSGQILRSSSTFLL